MKKKAKRPAVPGDAVQRMAWPTPGFTTLFSSRLAASNTYPPRTKVGEMGAGERALLVALLPNGEGERWIGRQNFGDALVFTERGTLGWANASLLAPCDEK